MKVSINGEARDIAAATVDAALEELGYAGASVATAVNEAFVPRSERAAHALREGDRIDVVAPMRGG